jgi:hypothetical protein
MSKLLSVLLYTLLLAGSALSAYAADENGGVQPATMEKYKKVREQVEALPNTTAAKYAPEIIKDANKSLTAAQNGLKAGNDKATRESAEMSMLQVTLAGVLADERATAAKTNAAKEALEKLEQRLSAILAGKGDN